jgi:transcriptional regulator
VAKRWTEEEDELLLKLRNEGFSAKEMSLHLKERNVGAIRMRLLHLKANQVSRKWLEDEKLTAWQLKEAGHTNKYIAKKLNRTPGAIAAFFVRDERNHYALTIPREK